MIFKSKLLTILVNMGVGVILASPFHYMNGNIEFAYISFTISSFFIMIVYLYDKIKNT